MSTLFSYIKERLSILDIVSHYVRLKNIGTYWKGSCPFHSETDASFTVSPDKQIFYCFGCHEGGDAIGFVAKIENMTQLEAAHHLIEQYQVAVPQELLSLKITAPEEKEAKDRYYAVCQCLASWAHEQLKKSSEASAYVKNRSITQETCDAFQVGYFPGGSRAFNSLMAYAQPHGFLIKDFLEYNIVLEGRGSFYSPFEERILFPINNSAGKTCGFGGRVFKAGDDRPKYYNSKEHEGFEKGKLLFGFQMAKKSMTDKGSAFLVEGYMDSIMMVQYGYTNTVATLGTACTLEHLKIISRCVNTLFVLYDGDPSGQQAMIRLVELAWSVNLDLNVIKLPPSHDPASFLIEHKTLDSLLSGAVDIMTFFVESLSAQFGTKSMAQKMEVAQKIALNIAKVTDPFKQDLLLLRLSTVTQLPFQSLKELLQSSKKATPRSTSVVVNKTLALSGVDDGGGNIAVLEEKIFSAILNGMDLGRNHKVPEALKPYFEQSWQQILELFEKVMHTHERFSAKHFYDLLQEPYKTQAMKASMKHGNYADERDFNCLLDRFCKYHWKQIVKDMRDRMKQVEQDVDQQKLKEHLDQFNVLKSRMMNRGSL
jgi:DNA primase